MKKISLLLLLVLIFTSCEKNPPIPPPPPSNTKTFVTGPITQNTIWYKDSTYILSGFVFVKNGATLTIQPGTTIFGDKASKGTLIITRGSKIIAEGTPTQPIVFTSAQSDSLK